MVCSNVMPQRSPESFSEFFHNHLRKTTSTIPFKRTISISLDPSPYPVLERLTHNPTPHAVRKTGELSAPRFKQLAPTVQKLIEAHFPQPRIETTPRCFAREFPPLPQKENPRATQRYPITPPRVRHSNQCATLICEVLQREITTNTTNVRLRKPHRSNVNDLCTVNPFPFLREPILRNEKITIAFPSPNHMQNTVTLGSFDCENSDGFKTEKPFNPLAQNLKIFSKPL